MLQECTNIKHTADAEHPYSDGLRLGDFIWIGGQFPIDGETGKLVEGDIKAQTRKAMENILCILKNYELNADHLTRMTIYMTDMDEYDDMSCAYGEFFHNVYPTRTVVGVNALPHHAKIEIEAYALDTRALEVLCEEDCCDDDDDGFCSIGV